MEQRSARHFDRVEVAGSNPAETTHSLPWPSGNGTRFTSGRSQVRVLSLPLIKDVLLGEQSSSNLDAEGSNPSVLVRVSVAEQPRTTLPRWTGGCDSRRTLFRPVTLPVLATWLSTRRDGFDSRTGRCSSAGGRGTRRPPATRLEAGSTPAGPTAQSCGAAECSPPRHGGGRWFESSRDY